MSLAFFLTAYDPSDLPSGSIDPLGFERGYLHLADQILPGLTNVAARPRYFGVLCAGFSLAKLDRDATSREQTLERRETAKRFERFWVLANVLASRSTANGELPLAGLRGVRYAQEYADRLAQRGASETAADFRLLVRQEPYGMLGIYGAVAVRLRMLQPDSLALSPSLGDPLGEAFLAETKCPTAVQSAVQNEGKVPLDALAEWGERAHVSRRGGRAEGRLLRQALHLDQSTGGARSRCARLLAEHPARDGETEIDRIERLHRACGIDSELQDLRAAFRAIATYERAYRWMLLGFERALWCCRRQPNSRASLDDLREDRVLAQVVASLPAAMARHIEALDEAPLISRAERSDVVGDTRRLFEESRERSRDAVDFVTLLVSRHNDVQRGKIDRGRPKMPWVERTPNGFGLTLTSLPDDEPTSIEQIEPHPYRLTAADALIDASRA